MDPHIAYNQAGPSNYTQPFSQPSRPPNQYNRGGGQNNFYHGHYHGSMNGYVPPNPYGMNSSYGNNVHIGFSPQATPHDRGATHYYYASPLPVELSFQSHTAPLVPPSTTSPYTQGHHPDHPTSLPQPLQSNPYANSNGNYSPKPQSNERPPLSPNSLNQKSPSAARPPPLPHSPQASAKIPFLPQMNRLKSPRSQKIYLAPAQSPTSSNASLPPSSPTRLAAQEWVISSFIPDNPANAFGITISPKAKPPAHIIRDAMEHNYPAVQSPKSITKEPLPLQIVIQDEETEADQRKEAITDIQTAGTQEPISSSATETESVMTDALPGSPVSTSTSISLAVLKTDASVDVDPLASSVSSIRANSVPQTPQSQASDLAPSSATGRSSVASSMKKSWASLLRPDASASTSGKPSNHLPMSAVVGFSVPAESDKGSSQLSSAPLAKKNELLKVLAGNFANSTSMPQIRPRGLVNTGNMCFANAVLQVLVYCPPFFRLFFELGKLLSDPSWERTDASMSLTRATIQFLKEFKPKPKTNSEGEDEDDEFDGIDSFIPSYVYDAMKEKACFDNMGGGQQEDAEEFFGFLLDALEEELLAVSGNPSPSATSAAQSSSDVNGLNEGDWLEVGKKNRPLVTRTVKSVDSPITRIFGGKFRSTLKVPGQRDSVLVEDWRALQLDIQRDQVNSIEDALRCISLPQPVQVSSITKGNAVVDATQQVLVESLPPVLVLHLKRFHYDTVTKGVVKIGKQVVFGPELDIPSDAISPVRRSAQSIKYKLFAVLYHHGQSAAGGHYTLDVLHPNRNADLSAKPREGWIRIDDELVSDLRAKDVFANIDDRSAYLLFYRRINKS